MKTINNAEKGDLFVGIEGSHNSKFYYPNEFTYMLLALSPTKFIVVRSANLNFPVGTCNNGATFEMKYKFIDNVFR